MDHKIHGTTLPVLEMFLAPGLLTPSAKRRPPRRTTKGEEEMFEAHEVAKELIEALREPLALIARHDAELAKQLRRAGPSVLQNIGEGARRSGKDRTYHYSVAAGIGGEVRDVLYIARAWKYVEASKLERAEQLLDRVLAVLWSITSKVGIELVKRIEILVAPGRRRASRTVRSAV